MSSSFSSILALLLFAVLAAPAVLAGVRGSLSRIGFTVYALLLTGVLAYYSSLPGRASSETSALAQSVDQEEEASPCERALVVAQRNRIVLDRSSPDRLVVNREFWRMLPEQVRVALTECARQVGSQGEGQAIQVVERAG